jgi:PAS domain S-box-containing protein
MNCAVIKFGAWPVILGWGVYPFARRSWGCILQYFNHVTQPQRTYFCRFPRLTLAVLAWIWGFAQVGFVYAESSQVGRRVLVLNSYHAGYSWSDGELQGLQRVLSRAFPGLIPSVEFLDAKRDPALLHHEEQLAYIRHKYDGGRFDLIITLDDAALQFALEHRQVLGEEVPIVFGGVNNYRPERFSGVPRITGVAEAFDFAGNLDLALQLRPKLKTMHLLIDAAESTKDTLVAFEKVAVGYRNRLRFERIEGWTAEGLLERVAALPPEDVIFYIGGARDINGRIVSEDQDYLRTLYERCAAPIIMVNQPVLPLAYGPGWENAIWYGLGGRMISADLHGEAVGEIAVRILRGEDASLIPVVTASPTRLAFNYRQMQRHNIDPSRLPPEAEIFNRSAGFFELYRWRILGALLLILFLAGAVVVLLLNTWRRKRAEQALLLLRAAVDQAKDLIALIDFKGDVLYANPALVRVMRGEKMRALVRCDELWRGEDGSVLSFDKIGTLAADAGRWQQRVAINRQDGQPGFLQVIVTPIHSDEGRPSQFLLIGQDVTQESRLEEQVRVSQKMDAIGTLASGIAHDFNNILTAIVVNTELAEAELSRDHPATEMLGEMRKATERASHLVRQILTFSRHAEPKRENLCVTPIIKETLKFLRATVPASVEIKHSVVASPKIGVDPTQLYQVVLNLCTNAAHAIGGRAGLIDVVEEAVDVGSDMIAAHPDLVPGLHLKLSVKDNGEGMPAEVVRRIFEPFYTTKKPGQGTGLGLSVVHGILKQHRATITVYSSPGQGTVFHLYFPAVQNDASQLDGSGGGALPVVRGTGQRIVLVDDELAITQVASRVLEQAGFNVTTFNLPDTALEYLRAGGCDLLITDYSMPGIGAFQLVRRVRVAVPNLPVILISGYLTDADRQRAAELGIDSILDKPLSVRSLMQAVASACKLQAR